MPITPHFSLTQDEERVWVDIQVPHVRVSRDSVEVVVEDECRMHFYANPYLLVLTLPHAIHESEDHVTATLDPMLHGGTIRLTLIKKEPQLWPDLDLLANLMQQKKRNVSQRPGNVVQEIISETTTTTTTTTTITNMEDETDKLEELFHDPSADMENNQESLLSAFQDDIPHYGFNNMFHHIFADLVREGVVFVELPQPDLTPSQERRKLRKMAEASKFDPDRYLQDCHVEDDYIFQCAMAMTPHWATNTIPTSNATTPLHSSLVNTHDTATETVACNNNHVEEESTVDNIVLGMSQLHTNDQDEVTTVATTITPVSSSSHDFFTSEELAKLASIPYPLLSKISRQETIGLLLGLIDLLYAYVYDHLLTDGEPTVESAWTVSMLTCSLSWLDVPESSKDSNGTWGDDGENNKLLHDVICASLRRTLIYPYLRNFDFGLYCWKQVQIIVANGRRCIMRCLLQMRSILDKSECHYLGNKLFVDPYLVWLQQPQSITNQDLDQLAIQLHRILSPQQDMPLSKEQLELDLMNIDEEATESDDEDDSLEDGTESSSSSSSSEKDEDDERDKVATMEEGNDTEKTNGSNQVELVDGAMHALTVKDVKYTNPSDCSLLDIEEKLETEARMLPLTDKGPAMPSIVMIQEL